MPKFLPLPRILWVVQYDDGTEFINRDRLSKGERADLKKRGVKFRERPYDRRPA
jgi:hypothetical protein